MATCVGDCKVALTVRAALVLSTVVALVLAQCAAAPAAPAAAPAAAAAPAGDAPDSEVLSDAAMQECLTQEDTEAICQRCAKSTRSTMVYPMCCRNQEDVRAWCVRYLDYGLQ